MSDAPRTSWDRLVERSHRALDVLDELMHMLVALALLVLALASFGAIIKDDFAAITQAFSGSGEHHLIEPILSGLDDVLFVVIILELLRTVTSHLKEHTFALRPFLTIGIIAAIRHVLLVGARMSVGAHAEENTLFNQHLAELAVNGVLTVMLVGAYLWVKRSGE